MVSSSSPVQGALAYLICSGCRDRTSGLTPDTFYQPTFSGRKADMLVTESWPDNHPDDFDTYVEDPPTWRRS